MVGPEKVGQLLKGTAMNINKYKVEKIILTIFIFAIALGFIFPFIWMISTSFKFEADVME